MPVFLERFVLPVLAASVITVILINPFKWDLQQRISAFVLVVALAYFVGHTLTRKRAEVAIPPVEIPAAPTVTTPQKTGDATANGENNVANTGNANNINSSPPSAKKPPKKE